MAIWLHMLWHSGQTFDVGLFVIDVADQKRFVHAVHDKVPDTTIREREFILFVQCQCGDVLKFQLHISECMQALLGNCQHGRSQIKACDVNVFFSARQFFQNQAGAASNFKHIVEIWIRHQFINYFFIVIVYVSSIFNNINKFICTHNIINLFN